MYTDSLLAGLKRFPQDPDREEEVSAVNEVDFVHQVALIALLLENHSSRLVGACRYVIYDPSQQPGRAEYALTVLTAYQGLGIGTVLFQHLVHLVKAGGITVST